MKFLPLPQTVFFLIVLLWPLSDAMASIPSTTIDRLAQINVERAEIRHLNAIGKLSDQEYKSRHNALAAEQEILSKPLMLMQVHPPELAAEINEATTAITGLTRAKLSLLEPKWEKELAAFTTAQGKRRSDMFHDVEKNAHQGARIQKQRQELQAQLDKGTIDKATFDWKDAEALAAIQALRNKNDPQGRAGFFFDERLTLYTSRINDPPPKPAPPPPLPRIPEPHTPAPKPFSIWDIFSGGTIVLLIWVAAGIVMVAAIIMNARPKAQPQSDAPPLTDIHGSAQWHPVEWITGEKDRVSRGVHFGKSSDPQYTHADKKGHPVFTVPTVPITSKPEAHTLVIAQTGSGKGTRIITPTLLRYASSMLVIDPKGENAAITARTRQRDLKQDVQILNPWGVLKAHYASLGFQTATYNPLDALDRNDPNAATIARSLAATICPITDAKNAFWQGSAATLLSGILLYLTDNPLETKTIGRARQIVTLPKAQFQQFLAKMLASNAFDGSIRESVGQASDPSAADTYGGILYNLQQATAFIDGQIKTSTATSTITMEKLAEGTLTLYVVIPFKLMKTHSAWLRLIISAAMHALITSRDKSTGKPQYRCMFLIDEFGSIGYIPEIAADLAQMRGYGMDFTLVLQGLNQLKEHYKDSKDSIIGNCRYKYFCDVGDLESAKYLSESLGKKTVRTVSKSSSTGATQAGQTQGESVSYSETGRALFNPDEIMNLGKNIGILLHPDGAPHYLQPVDYWNLTEAYDYFKRMDPQFYWEPPLQYDRNPYHNDPPKPPKPSTPISLPTNNNGQQPTSGGIMKSIRKFLGFSPKAPAAPPPPDPSVTDALRMIEETRQFVEGKAAKPQHLKILKPPVKPPPEPPHPPTVQSLKDDVAKMIGWAEEARRIALQRQPKPTGTLGEEVFTDEDIQPPSKPPKPPNPKNPNGSIGEDVF